MKRTIAVLQDDIDNGKKRRPSRCAIARAANRDLADLIGADYRAKTGGYTLSFNSDTDVFVHADLPFEAQVFISTFDKGEPVEPFKFEVDLEFLDGGECPRE